MKHAVVSPCYGRDYRNKKDAEKDFRDGKDFTMENFMDPYCGKPCNLQDLKAAGYDSIEIRYQKLTKLTVVKL